MSDAVHYQEVLQDLLDGRLTADLEPQVREHVATCPTCRAELRRLESGRTAAASLRRALPPPDDLVVGLGAALDAEDALLEPPEVSRKTGHDSRSSRWPWALVGVAATLLLALAVWWARTPDIPTLVARDFVSVRAGDLALSIRTAVPAELEQYFARAGQPGIRVIDLGMMGFTLEGGRRHQLGTQPSALYVYRGTNDDRLVCQMYPGTDADLPAAADVREHKGFKFHVVRRGNVTLVFWREGDILCVLASEMEQEGLVALAFAKAMHPG